MIRALGDSKTPVAFLIFATIINVGLALLFILKFGLGVPGSAYALVMAQGISAFLCVIYMWKHFPVLRLQKSDWKWDKQFAIAHLKIGLPMAGQMDVNYIPCFNSAFQFLETIIYGLTCCRFIG